MARSAISLVPLDDLFQTEASREDATRERVQEIPLCDLYSFDAFLAAMRAAGCEVKGGKHLAFKIPDGKRFIRCDSLDEDYSEG